ncbi:DUF6317 family protein [Actinomadura sp. 6N118]|uniref:DUF6317 family protein n=1 Tax=Actinomadura sp. 6N118 TaxID=3375151 RepID=UPI0037A64380
MSAEIKVVFKDILAASSIFKSQGKRYDAIVPRPIKPVPVVTDSSLDASLSLVLQSVALVYDSVGASMQAHGDKLKSAHDRYVKVEDDVSDLMKSIDVPKDVRPRIGN